MGPILVPEVNGPFDFFDTVWQRKIEVKSGSARSVYGKKWRFHFKGVKLGNFDALVLVFHFPERLEMYLWDNHTGVSRNGLETGIEGHVITFGAI